MAEHPEPNAGSASDDEPSQLLGLVLRYFDNEGEVDNDSLVTALETEAECRRLFVDLALQRTALVRVLRETPAEKLRSVAMIPSIDRRPSMISGWSFAASTLLVCLLFYGGFAMLAWNLRPEKVARVDRAQPSVEKPNPSAGTLTAEHNCVWQAAAGTQPRVGMRIATGESLELVSGMAEVLFTDGAAVLLEGPMTFAFESPHGGYLHRGKLVARVSPQAVGFTVQTPSATVVDLGTEFGVEVDDYGTAEVHVFEGRVVAQGIERNGRKSNRLELRESEAARFGAGENAASKLTAAPQRFRRVMSTNVAKTRLVQPDSMSGLQLWLKADAGAYSRFSDDGDYSNDTPAKPGQSVEGWRDFSGHQRHPIQPNVENQPTLQVNARHAAVLRFAGNHWLERSGLVLNYSDPSSFTIIAAFEMPSLPVEKPERNEGLMALFGQFSSAGDTSRYFGVSNQDRLFHAEYRGEPSRVFLGQGRSIVPERPQIGELIRDRGQRALHVLAPGESDISTDSETCENYVGAAPVLWRIGARWHPQTPEYFRGEIAEVLIYDRALTRSEQRNIELYLASRFFAERKGKTQ